MMTPKRRAHSSHPTLGGKEREPRATQGPAKRTAATGEETDGTGLAQGNSHPVLNQKPRLRSALEPLLHAEQTRPMAESARHSMGHLPAHGLGNGTVNEGDLVKPAAPLVPKLPAQGLQGGSPRRILIN